jgi:hypothetical protein
MIASEQTKLGKSDRSGFKIPKSMKTFLSIFLFVFAVAGISSAASSADFEIEFRNQYKGRTFVSVIERGVLDKAPKWRSDAKSPPIAPGEAVEIATSKMEKVNGDLHLGTTQSLDVSSICSKTTNVTGGYI